MLLYQQDGTTRLLNLVFVIMMILSTAVTTATATTNEFGITVTSSTGGSIVSDIYDGILENNTSFIIPNDLLQPFDDVDHINDCNRILLTDTSIQQQDPWTSAVVVFQRVIVFMDDLTLRILLPTYVLIIVLYIVLLLSHQYVVTQKKYYLYYYRIVSFLLSFFLPGIRISPPPPSSEYSNVDDVTDDATITTRSTPDRKSVV